MEITELTQGFTAQFHATPEQYFFAPGRINLIGEHTDYNGGHVFPCAISLGTYAAVRSNGSASFNFYSANFPADGILRVPLSDLDRPRVHKWVDYAVGMLQVLAQNGATFGQGLDVYIQGDLPDGAGLSSSASLEMLIGEIANDMYGLDVPMLTRVHYGQTVENDYIGVNSGIMDQFAIGMGQANSATLLDTNTMEYERLPLDLGENEILIMNTKKQRQLTDSKYNERRSECDSALAKLQTELDITSLGDLDASKFDEYSYLIGDGTLLKRARHAVLENQRTIRAAAALKSGDLATFGHLVSASGVSLQYDYEVTGLELDTLVHSALQQKGVLGARMIGAGFGGCAIALVDRTQVAAVIAAVGKEYAAVVGHPAEFYRAEIADGPRALGAQA
ncbi:galactokinase [Lacticaseibacillus zhaodongensis]|uniref:galactokinase n=1 Tax=Lacticaseibacillus zhaodongensis TaxID=2668065 RepID=UPI0012D34E9E|nr:galactokinase [Lacticaseibacillus zhaodongensis]